MRYSRLKLLGTALVALTILGGGITSSVASAQSSGEATMPAARQEVTFTSWVGPYMRSQMLGFVRPYEAKSGVKVNVESYSGGIDEIRDQVESANVTWDVVDLTQADSLRACNEGLLEDLSDIQLPNGADGTAFRDDFVEGALNKCGVGVIVWGTAYAYNKSIAASAGAAPATIADFFDTDKFPGRRAIRNDPSVVMEWAAIADGVAPADVYKTLESEEGVARALERMSSIKTGLRFWTKGSEPVRLLNDGEVAMSMVWATTGATNAKKEGATFEMVWDGRVIELDLFGIPKGTLNKQAAIDFISFASSSESLAKMVGYLPNGPTRKSSLALLSDDILAQLPNGPSYADKAHILSDAEWWSGNYDRLKEAYDAWLTEVRQKGAAGTVR